MFRVAVLVFGLGVASCGSITAGAPGDGAAPANGGAPGTGFRGGVSTLGPAAVAQPQMRVIRQGLGVPASPVCKGSICFSGGITQ